MGHAERRGERSSAPGTNRHGLAGIQLSDSLYEAHRVFMIMKRGSG